MYSAVIDRPAVYVNHDPTDAYLVLRGVLADYLMRTATDIEELRRQLRLYRARYTGCPCCNVAVDTFLTTGGEESNAQTAAAAIVVLARHLLGDLPASDLRAKPDFS